MLNAMPASYAYVEQKSYKLPGDGNINGAARITCWKYGNEEVKVDIRVDVRNAFHSKGRGLLSAYIIDVDKNGPESYLQIGKAAFPNNKYDYAIFTQQFTAKQFPAAKGDVPCPIGSTGRIVIVMGTSPPKDSYTLSKGVIDIIAATTAGTAKDGLL
jgi:hypothetical protein